MFFLQHRLDRPMVCGVLIIISMHIINLNTGLTEMTVALAMVSGSQKRGSSGSRSFNLTKMAS